MTREFDVRELLRVAVCDERGGQRLYQTLAGKAQHDSLRKTFDWLSKQEKEHERRFEEMLGNMEPAPTTGQYPDEYVDYLESVVQQGGTDRADTEADSVERDVDAIGLAIRFEREQLALQKDIADVLGDQHREVIDAVLGEERDHLVRLSEARRRLTEEQA